MSDMRNTTLPAEFSDLTPLVANWALADERERHLRMIALGIDELRQFYNTMLPRYPAIVAYLNRFPLGGLPADAKTLFDLAETFVETAHPIDLNWRTPDIEDSFPMERLEYLFRGRA
ncbi:MAG: hypothetical protein AB7G15_02405 [Alphaproteobacteria bacterium]